MRPLVLVILDGWGMSTELKGNAIFSTPTPNYDKLLSMFPSTTLHASGEEVGLSWGEMGNSEVGHLNLGTGRVVMQDLPRIDKSIHDGSFFQNQPLTQAFAYARQNNSYVHMIGLFSAGGVHSHLNHLLALMDMAKKENFSNVCIHLIADGRDTPQKTILQDLPCLEEKIKQLGFGQIVSLSGRYYAMDRDNRTERTQKALNVLTNTKSPTLATVSEAINAAYQKGQTDEFIEPVRIGQGRNIQSKDAVIFYNFRSDRARQLSNAILNIPEIYFVSFTSYGQESTPLIKVAFFADKVSDQLAMILADQKLSQFHLAETEKYPHITYFFNGGWEKPFNDEERILIESPKVETYDLKPEMSATAVTTKFIEYFKDKKPIFTVINFANTDMVGHTGKMEATQRAVAAVDENLGKMAQAVLNNESDLLVSADHGNAEQMINLQTGEPDKEHTTNPVPIIMCFNDRINKNPVSVTLEMKVAQAAREPSGILADITATIVHRLGLAQSPLMTGQNLSEVL